MERIFLISGSARNGKDTVADIIMDKLDGDSIKISMADYLKFMATKYYNWDGIKDKNGRDTLQQLGTNKIREDLGWETFHAERVCQDIEIIKDEYDYVFIPDVRFKNEMYYTMAKFPYSCTSIKVERLNFENNLTDAQRKHRSEVDLIGFEHDYRVSSENGLLNVENQIDAVLGSLIGELNKKREEYR